ncbi:hypothetical protein AB0K05_03350 [Nonomuraea sp. NPDC049486]|uniref:hypothetical protein n=1 Tax=Nonomuraea sp. NPDC049486 TaxID=3155773 RepID=UPI00341E4EB7
MRLRALDLLRERSLGEYGPRVRCAPGIAVFEKDRAPSRAGRTRHHPHGKAFPS